VIETTTLSLLIAGGVIAVGLLQLILGRAGRALAEDWMAAAEAAGLADASTTNVGGSRLLKATHGALRIRMRAAGQGTRVTVDGLAEGFQVALQDDSIVDRVRVRQDVVTGDERFDREVVVHARPLRALALLEAETRASLADLAAGRGVFGRTESRLAALVDGRLVALCLHTAPSQRVVRLTEMLRALLALCERLTPQDADEERIAAHLAAEPEAAVRLRGLEILIAERPDHPATARAVRAALSDRDDTVRFTAALSAGDAGLPVLRGAGEAAFLGLLASAAAAVRDRAARALGRIGTAASVPALRDAEPALGRAAREAIAAIQSRLPGAAEGQLSVAAPSGEVSLTDDAQGRLSRDEP
jgi:hypothetical protein